MPDRPTAPAHGSHKASVIVVKVKSATAQTIAPGFVGLTVEAADAGDPAFDVADSNLPSFLAELGPANLRVGGQTTEFDTAWQPDPSDPLPPWATSAITPADFTMLAGLAQATGWSVDLGVGILHDDPAGAASEVAAAHAILGSSLHDVEIGNEPELLSLTSGVGFSQYLTELDAYRTAIKAVDPGVTTAGPDFYLPSWLSAFGQSKSAGVKGLSEFTQHFYPLTDCTTPVSIADLFSSDSILYEDQIIADAEAAARKGHLPLVLDEFNSVSCGSSSPVIYQFASALWAVHALLEAAAQGVASVNVQSTLGNCLSYTPLCAPDPSTPGTLVAQPIFYGMQLVSALEGGTLLRSSVTSAEKLPTGVSQYTVALPGDRVAVVVDNTTSAAVTGLELSVAGSPQLTTVTNLTASGLSATTGVTLTTSTASGSPTGLTVPAGSAAVFTLSG